MQYPRLFSGLRCREECVYKKLVKNNHMIYEYGKHEYIILTFRLSGFEVKKSYESAQICVLYHVSTMYKVHTLGRADIGFPAV